MAVAVQETVPAPVTAASAPVQETKFAPTEVVSGSGPVQRLPLAPGLQVGRT